MGGAVSTGQNNNDLIDNLLEADYIRNPLVEAAFRAVDRGDYFLPASRPNAYKDLAWKSGHLHLSAPCIYSEVMEGLCLRSGLSFLNLGSGTGYLSTMIGLIIGSHGVNHGVEIHGDVVEYANKRLEEFRKYSGAIDQFDFCEPKYLIGNCLCLSSDAPQYDRIYCGAACPLAHESYIKNLLKVGGILVMPINDQLVQMKRTSETNWDVRCLLPVSFATLIQPQKGEQEILQMIPIEPLTLQALSRVVIRNILRKNLLKEYPNLTSTPALKKIPKKKRTLRRLVVPFFDSSEDNSDNDEQHSRNRDLGRVHIHDAVNGDDEFSQTREVSALIDIVLERLRDQRNQDEHLSFIDNVVEEREYPLRRRASLNDMDTYNRNDNTNVAVGYLHNSSEDVTKEKKHNSCDMALYNMCENANAELTHGEPTFAALNNDSIIITTEMFDVFGDTTTHTAVQNSVSEPDCKDEGAIMEHSEEKPSTSESDDKWWLQDMFKHRCEHEQDNIQKPNEVVNMENDVQAPSNVNKTESEQFGVIPIELFEIDKIVNMENSIEGSEKNSNPNKTKREKFDSGLGDEFIEKGSSSGSTSDDAVMYIHSLSSSDEHHEEKRHKRISGSQRTATCGKLRRVTLPNQVFDSSASEEEHTQNNIEANEVVRNVSSFTAFMRNKINALPLPTVLKCYLNFYREL